MVSTYWANEALRLLYKNNTGVTFYIGLSSTMPRPDGSNLSEPVGGNYARRPIAAFKEPTEGKISNAQSIEFPLSTDVWFSEAAKAAYYVIFDGPDASAHVLGAGTFYIPMAVDANQKVIVAEGLLSISLTGEEGGR